jgi:hypothetical protein
VFRQRNILINKGQYVYVCEFAYVFVSYICVDEFLEIVLSVMMSERVK